MGNQLKISPIENKKREKQLGEKEMERKTYVGGGNLRKKEVKLNECGKFLGRRRNGRNFVEARENKFRPNLMVEGLKIKKSNNRQ